MPRVFSVYSQSITNFNTYLRIIVLSINVVEQMIKLVLGFMEGLRLFLRNCVTDLH